MLSSAETSCALRWCPAVLPTNTVYYIVYYTGDDVPKARDAAGWRVHGVSVLSYSELKALLCCPAALL
jgi:hypothetical protein